ncbi:MAG: hypothetical protein AAGK17_03925 [Pseudomonadota bacterium]
MPNTLLEDLVDELAGDAAQLSNAMALLFALGGTALANIESESISLNPYTNAVCFDWLVGGEWSSLEVEIYADHFETYLSRDRELRIKHWPSDPKPQAIDRVIKELLAGTV